MPAPQTRPARSSQFAAAALFGLSLVALTGTTGCMTVKRMNGREIPLAGTVVPDASQPYVVQVENQLGSVRIYAKPELRKPEVYAIASDEPGRTAARPTEAQLRAWVAASVEQGEDAKILRVLSADPNLEKRPVLLNIFVPSISGVVVRNTGGDVLVRDIAGPVQVFNGVTTGNGGEVVVDTNESLSGPVSIKSRGGNITVRVGSSSAGKLDIQGKHGAYVEAPERALVGIRATPTTYRADLGNLGQDFKLQAEDGKATLLVKPAN